MDKLLDNYRKKLLESKKALTVEGYLYDIGIFIEFLKKRNQITEDDDNINSPELFNDLNEADLFTFIEALRVKQNSVSSINRKISALKGFFKYLLNNKLVDRNISASIKLLKTEGGKEQNSLSVAEVKSLLNSICGRNAQRDKLIFMLLLTAGTNVEELINLNISDVTGEYISVGRTTPQERYSYKNEALRSILSDFLLTVNNPMPEKALFEGREKSRISKRTVQQILNTRMKKSGLYLKGDVAQLLRRSGALIIYHYCNADIIFISKYLGHKNTEQTKKFLMFEKDIRGVDLDKNPLAKL